VHFSSVIGDASEEEESNSVDGGGVCDLSGLLSRLDSPDTFASASLSIVMASGEGPSERGKLEKRNTSCRGTIDAFTGEGISCPRSRRRMVGEAGGKVCARCFGDAPGCSWLVQGSSSGLTAEKSNGPLGRLVSVTARCDCSANQPLVNHTLVTPPHAGDSPSIWSCLSRLHCLS